MFPFGSTRKHRRGRHRGTRKQYHKKRRHSRSSSAAGFFDIFK